MSESTLNTPRLRSMLRQAKRVANSGKRAAAAQLYRDVVEEAPQSVEAWLGLAAVAETEAAQRAAYERALTLAPENETAKAGLAALAGQQVDPPAAAADTSAPVPPPSAPETAPPVPEIPQGQTAVAPPVAVAEPDTLVCYRHAGRETNLRCYSCDRPICSSCAIKTPVGYRCPECIREAEDVFYTAKLLDYILAPLVAFPIAAAAGWLALRFGVGFFIILIIIFAGGAIGNFIGRLASRVAGRRRGRYLPHTVAAAVVVGILLPSLPLILITLTGNIAALIRMAAPGILAFVVASAAFYRLR